MESDMRYLMKITVDRLNLRTPEQREESANVLFSVLQKDFLAVIAIPDGELRADALNLFAARLARTCFLASC